MRCSISLGNHAGFGCIVFIYVFLFLRNPVILWYSGPLFIFMKNPGKYVYVFVS